MATTMYRNPVIPGFNPDPSICHVPGKGYFLATSTFEFFPGLPVYHSTNLVDWKLIGHAINRRSQGVDMRTVEANAGLWAPTFRYHKGRWYMICGCFWRTRFTAPRDMISSGFYVSTDDIFDDSRWSEAVYFDEVGFDQDLFFDDDDRVYQTVTRFDFSGPAKRIESWITEIDLATGTSLTPPVLARASPLGVAEGCHILKRDGAYYLLVAEGGTEGGHRECVYRSTSPMGPYEAPPDGVNPLVYNHDHPRVQNTGHLDIIPVGDTDDGNWVGVCLGVRPVFPAGPTREGIVGMPSQLGRETFLMPVKWVDGWPVINNRDAIDIVGSGDFGGAQQAAAQTRWIDQFDGDALSLGWYHVRVPLRKAHWVGDAGLALRGCADTLDVDHCPTVLLRKQTAFNLDWETEVAFAPAPGQEAGTVAWVAKGVYASLGVRGAEGGAREVVFTRPGAAGAGAGTAMEKSTFPVGPTGPVKLVIRARTAEYTFAFSVGTAEMMVVGSVPARTLIPLFTGVHLGVYAQGHNSAPCVENAVFRYCKWDVVVDGGEKMEDE